MRQRRGKLTQHAPIEHKHERKTIRDKHENKQSNKETENTNEPDKEQKEESSNIIKSML